MLIPIGFFGGGATGSYDLIQSTILSTSATSVTFSSLPSGYKYLQVAWVARTNRADYQDTMGVSFNGVTAGYTTHNLRGNSTAVAGSTATAAAAIWPQSAFDMAAANETGAMFGAGVTEVYDYQSTSKNPVAKTLSGLAGGTQTQSVILTSGILPTAGAITSITFASRYGASFTAGSRFSLYGIKGQ